MKQSLQLRTSQQLTMTPQLQQAIRLLQLSGLELQAEIQEALESNPLLEEQEEEEPEGSEIKLTSDDQIPFDPAPDSAPEGEEEKSETEFSFGEGAIPADLPIDVVWDDLYDLSGLESHRHDPSEKGYESCANAEKSLREHLLEQVQLAPFSPIDEWIATVLVDFIDEGGYLTCTLEEIQSTVSHFISREVELDEIEAVLRQVQHFDPVGVGARDLRECLQLQLRALPISTPWRTEANLLVANYLPLLARHDRTQLASRMALSEEALRKVVHLVQQLNPRPGNQVTRTEVQYVIPDVLVNYVRGTWKVELNEETAARLRVNPFYAALVRRADYSADNQYLRTHLQEARWFIKSLQSRNETLIKVSTAIVERQRAFLEQGDEAMRPLVLHDISDALGMHESTISRVTTRKYMDTPRGIYELKYFFSSHLSTATGEDCSSTATRAFIRRLVAAENPVQPLSDHKISILLGAQGIQVARRTVAKYREAMSIPTSNERKRLS